LVLYAVIYIQRCLAPQDSYTLYICTSIKQYNHLTFDGTPLSNKRNTVKNESIVEVVANSDAIAFGEVENEVQLNIVVEQDEGESQRR
jgi:hypothetical protein